MGAPAVWLTLFLSSFLIVLSSAENSTTLSSQSSLANSLCAQLVDPAGYSCTEHAVQTKDGYILGLQNVAPSIEQLEANRRHPVLLLHGLFMAGDAWFLDSTKESLGFLLASHGFDVWVGNVRGTRWSFGHASLSNKDKEFWNWSWQDLAFYDVSEMIEYIHSKTNSLVSIVGHSQGSIISFAGLTQPHIAKLVKAAAFLCPITYLNHITAPLVRKMVTAHFDQMIQAIGLHQVDFRSDLLVRLVDSLCEVNERCGDYLSSITGKNCCFNDTRVPHYFKYEPHPSSVKNLRHLFQMIRQGTFSKYDYGPIKNVVVYGQLKPPAFDISRIPASLPMWFGYGGQDGLADVIDVERTLKEIKLKPRLLYLQNYGHLDFLLSMKGKADVYDHLIQFLKSPEKSSSY